MNSQLTQYEKSAIIGMYRMGATIGEISFILEAGYEDILKWVEQYFESIIFRA